jgi:diguanylate cyclase (GGDEF)-like protein
MSTINQEERQAILGQLGQALHNHEMWFDSITRALLCHLPYDPLDVRDNAHRECQFGQWYYNHTSESLRQHPAFNAIEQEHALMHRLAAQLLRDTEKSSPIEATAYDRFANSVQRLRLQVTSVQRELQDSLFNLDPLTGARNRLGMLTRLREQHELVKRKAQVCSVVMMDLDHFKKVNDTYGHHVGDLALKSVALYVLGHIRPYDTLFRYGGEEFLLCIQQTDIRAAAALANRLREGIEALVIEGSTEATPRITMSFGIAPLDPAVFVEESLRRADEALYQAKKEGRNRVIVWEGAESPS